MLRRLITTTNKIKMTSPEAKKLKTTPYLIGTHSGTFHCDESLAFFLLNLLPKFKNNSTLIRTRDSSKLEECDLVIDVGGQFNLESLRFDHHQRGFNQVFGGEFITKLSSAGLIYK